MSPDGMTVFRATGQPKVLRVLCWASALCFVAAAALSLYYWKTVAPSGVLPPSGAAAGQQPAPGQDGGEKFVAPPQNSAGGAAAVEPVEIEKPAAPIAPAIRVGDSASVFDKSRYDESSPQIKEWVKAGVHGGIPLRGQSRIVAKLKPGDKIGSIGDVHGTSLTVVRRRR